jgi:alkanesulfonate monooxygenase SsuD/methylene tetrahydromethanopterin reductase-like flavin-dependent oxidoreductase (luciferase family)
VQLCLEVWGTDYEKVREACIHAEKLGYHGFYYGESLSDIDLDCWTVLSSLSCLTTKIKLGPVITYPFPQYRNVALLAKQATTLQQISNGRLEFRIGAGATLQYAVQWWYPYGIEYPTGKERVSILEEALHVLKKLWDTNDDNNNNSSVYFSGKYFAVNGASIRRTITKIPITIAAKKKRMMNLAARYADTWESSYVTPYEFSHLNTEFSYICTNVNNNNNNGKTNITRSVELDVVIAESDSELEYKKRIFAMERGPGVYNQAIKHGLIGKPNTVAQRLREYITAGVDQFLLAFQDPLDLRALELLVDSLN